MNNPFLPFSRPSVSEKEIAAVGDVLRSGWLTTGAKTSEFEERFCCSCGAKHGVALGSATAGMHLLLTALNIGPGDEVITPSMTWVSTVNLIMLSGATPVFVDIDRHTLMTDAQQIESCISERTKLIIPVHFAGAPVDLEPIRQLAARRNISLVEDAAHAAGTTYRGQKIGQRGTVIFSFHPSKNITTGEGGMFCSDDPELVRTIRHLKFHGLGADAHDRRQQGRTPQAEVVQPGYKYNMTDISAALGLGQLERLDGFIKQRSLLARRYLDQLAGVDEILPLTIPDYSLRHSWHLLIIRLNPKRTTITRNQFMEGLKQRGIGTGIHFRPVHLHRYYRETLTVPPGSLENTEWNGKRLCSLPLFPSMTIQDVDRVVTAIKEIL